MCIDEIFIFVVWCTFFRSLKTLKSYRGRNRCSQGIKTLRSFQQLREEDGEIEYQETFSPTAGILIQLIIENYLTGCKDYLTECIY